MEIFLFCNFCFFFWFSNYRCAIQSAKWIPEWIMKLHGNDMCTALMSLFFLKVDFFFRFRKVRPRCITRDDLQPTKYSTQAVRANANTKHQNNVQLETRPRHSLTSFGLWTKQLPEPSSIRRCTSFLASTSRSNGFWSSNPFWQTSPVLFLLDDGSCSSKNKNIRRVMRALPLKQSNISKSKIIKCAMPHNRSKKKSKDSQM